MTDLSNDGLLAVYVLAVEAAIADKNSAEAAAAEEAARAAVLARMEVTAAEIKAAFMAGCRWERLTMEAPSPAPQSGEAE